MSRQGCTAALLLLTAVVGLSLAIAMPGCRHQTGSSKAESKAPESGAGGEITVIAEQPAAGRKTQAPPREIAVELGNGVKLEMVLIPAGEFLMGSPIRTSGPATTRSRSIKFGSRSRSTWASTW